MNRKKALMACPFPWDATTQVGGHHIARELVNHGWDVAFISSPISPLLLLGRDVSNLEGRFETYKKGGICHYEGHLWTYVPGALVIPKNRPLFRSELVATHWAQNTFPNLWRKLAEHGFSEVDLLYIDTPIYAGLLDRISCKKSIFRVADKLTGFEGLQQSLVKKANSLAKAVDAVAYTARNLEPYVAEMGAKSTFFMPNGVNFEHFAHGSKDVPPDLRGIPGPIAIYVGAIEEWFDYNLFNQTAEKLPHVSFVLIGPEKNALKRLKPRDNIHILGARNYRELPGYLNNSDVGLIPFNVRGYPELVNGVNPLKLYEYMACGLPVVAVEWEELKSINSPAFLCNGVDDFVEAITGALAQPDRSELYRNFASGFSWHKHVANLIDFLEGR